MSRTSAEPLRFGTDGWRGVIARDATFDNFLRLARAAASCYARGDFGPGDRTAIVIGHDTRFLAEELSRAVAEAFAEAGITAILTDAPIPTPAVSWEVRRRGLSGGVAITASHNPARYTGFKLKAHYGGSASPEIYRSVEREIDRPFRPAARAARVETRALRDGYLRALASRVDVAAIRAAGVSVLADAMHGAAGDALAQILSGGRARVESFRANRDVYFGGAHPEPIGRNLAPTARRLREGGFDLAVATDGDADRLGVVASDGAFVSPHRVLALLILHCFRHRGVRGGIARTFSTSLLIDRIGRSLGAEVHETGIGFKYVADLMIAGKAAVGGEESGGYGFAFHLPERDGTLSALLLLEHLAASRRGLDEALAALGSEFGELAYARTDVTIDPRIAEDFLRRVRARPPRAVAGEAVTGCRDLDGVKLELGGRGWLLMRKSGTEPMIRLYCEHESEARCREILSRAEARLAAFAGRGRA